MQAEFEFDVAIVGAGFAGIACAVALVRANPEIKIALLDPAAILPAGIAFAGAGAEHLLNVRADQMSMDSARPMAFCDFFAKLLGLERDAVCDQFAPRALYCGYVRSQLIQAQAVASAAGGGVTHITLLVDEICEQRQAGLLGQQQTYLVSGQQPKSFALTACHVILALGAGRYKTQIEHPRWHVGPWRLAQLPAHTTSDTALIIGSGLTGVDSAQTLHRLGWQGGIEMLSPRAQLPAANLLRAVEIWQLGAQFVEHSATPRLFIKNLRVEIARAKARGVGWRSVLNALRPITTRIFASWQPAQRASILRRAGSIWGTHRHRMPPESSQLMASLQANRTLKRSSGQFLRVSAISGAQLDIEIAAKAGNYAQKYALIIDARGPSYRVQDWPLLTAMIAADLIQPSATGFGLLVDQHGRVGAQIYALGVLTYGERLETMAVPEIRAQAERIAELILTGSLLDQNESST